jgi:hypothetical protein
VIGTDLSPTQPAWIPHNLKFEIDDCTKPWIWDANTFDFVHMRYLFGAITDWTALFKEAYSATKPGGWVESCESEPMTHSDDGTVTNDGSTALGGIWDRTFIEGGRITGCSLSVLTEDLQMKAMKEAGFVDIQEAFYKVSCPSKKARRWLTPYVNRFPLALGPKMPGLRRSASLQSSVWSLTLLVRFQFD